MQPPLITGPVPPYNNPPINPQYYQPRVFIITAISLGLTTTVTTSQNNDYVIGQLVRLLIPYGYGTTQLNEMTGYVISIPSANQVTINIYSQNFDPFVNANLPNKPQIVAVGDINSGVSNQNGRVLTGTFIPGSFINISPL